MKRLLLFLLLLSLTIGVAAQAPRLPDKFTETLYAGGISSPTAMAFAPDGRLFVLEKSGAVRVIDANGTLLPTPFYTFSPATESERGLLGIAFHPNFASNNYVYFYWTKPGASTRNRIDRLTANGNVAVAGSEFEIVQLEALSAGNHNGGAIHFGPDNKLYAAQGENAVAANSQTLNNRLGKILRYNPDGSIPTDNPFYETASGGNRAIWALGLRNPFTFAFQPGTGKMYINDVGAGAFEEINLGVAGGNYGWPATEGYHSNPAYISPVYAYANDTQTCAIAGGAFYNPETVLFPEAYVGDYFFADMCANRISVLDGNTATIFASPTEGGNPVDIKIGPDGALYYLSRSANAVYRIGYDAGPMEGEIARNRSFENDSNGDGIPNNWSAAGVKAKRVCNGKPFITDGSCALKIKRSGTGGGKVKQVIPAKSLVAGSSVSLSAMVGGKNVSAGALLKLQIITTAGKAVFSQPIPTGTYDAQLISLLPGIADAQGKKVKIIIKSPSAGGKVFVDEVSVIVAPPLR